MTRAADCCQEIASNVELIKDLVARLQEISRKYDYNDEVPGNGYRSLVCVCDIVLLRLVSMLRICSTNRSAMSFRVAHYCKEIESYGAILRFLILAFQQVKLMF